MVACRMELRREGGRGSACATAVKATTGYIRHAQRSACTISIPWVRGWGAAKPLVAVAWSAPLRRSVRRRVKVRRAAVSGDLKPSTESRTRQR